MNKKLKLSIVLTLATFLHSCTSGTTNSSPKFSEDFSKVENEIKVLTNSESVSFVDRSTMNWNNDIVERELRIDLIKPKQFPVDKSLRNIISAIKPKLIDSSKFTKYTITEVEGQHGKTIVFPAPNILKSVSINVENL